jgi:hypothetical protein
MSVVGGNESTSVYLMSRHLLTPHDDFGGNNLFLAYPSVEACHCGLALV